MSGACKGTTISVYKENNPGTEVVYSSIKTWKNYQNGIFNGLTEYNDITYGLLHMVQLEEFMNKNHDKSIDLIIERGVTDPLFYYYYNGAKETKEDNEMIKRVVEKENLLLFPDFHNIERILLVQKDKDFIKDYVLKDPCRQETFNNDLDNYLKLQDKYVDFTKKYNHIDNLVVIDNAKDYIKNTLGIEFNKI